MEILTLDKMTVQQVEEILENHEFPYDYERTDWYTKQPVRVQGVNTGWQHIAEAIEWGDKELKVPGLGTVTHVESYGGEGQGDSYWMVFKVTQGKVTRTFKRDGWYASHDGGYYDGPTTEVKPVQKTITVWE